MFWKKWSDKPWYSLTAAGCIIVLFLVFLLNIVGIWHGVISFLRLFRPVYFAIVTAFVVNQLSALYQRSIFKRIHRHRTRVVCSNTLAYLSVIAFLVFALAMVIPQLIESVTMLISNLGNYEAAIQGFIEKWSIFDNFRNSEFYQNYMASGSLPKLIGNYLVENVNHVLSAVTATGKGIVSWVISFILSIYILAEKPRLKQGFVRLIYNLFSRDNYRKVAFFLDRVNKILTSYVVYNIIDCLIIGLINAAFMVIAKYPYVGLISFIVAIMNLVPTFGPIVGAAIGAFLLLLVNPIYALVFLIFTIALQTLDGYLIKPKLFGSTLGVPGLWILISIIVLGRAFGVLGILCAIPVAAILDFIYKDYFIPWLAERRKKKDAEIKAAKDQSNDQPPTDISE